VCVGVSFSLQPNRPGMSALAMAAAESLQVIPCSFCTAAHTRTWTAGTVLPSIPSVCTSSEKLPELKSLRSRVC
jgi:hypothetical protein